MKRLLFGIIKKMKFLPTEFYLKIFFEYYTGKKLNLEDPKEFNEKIQWLKAYYRPPILTQLVDKYSVRSFVEERVGSQYLNTLFKVYHKVSDVNFDELPEQFVIKGAHGYNFNILVPDKSELNRVRAKLRMRKWMSKNQYYRGGLEWAYKNVEPKIIAEKYLIEEGKPSISDFKYFFFNGKPEFIQVDLDRSVDHVRTYVDMNWQPLEFETIGIKKNKGPVEIPQNHKEMTRVATKLAEGFPFVRVDLYNLQGKILFGELTFYPTDGRMEFYPDRYNEIIGNYLELPQIPEGKKYIDTF